VDPAAKKRQEELQKQQEEADKMKAAQEKRNKQKEKRDQRSKAHQEQEEALKRSRQESQRRRSTIFAHARLNEAKEVEVNIYEGKIDATGGECVFGMESDEVFLRQHHGGQIDPKETLLHIFARNGNFSMVQWLCEHSTETHSLDLNVC
jgi:hypothetical protein